MEPVCSSLQVALQDMANINAAGANATSIALTRGPFPGEVVAGKGQGRAAAAGVRGGRGKLSSGGGGALLASKFEETKVKSEPGLVKAMACSDADAAFLLK